MQGDENVNDANVSDGVDMDRQMPPVNLHPVIVGEIMGKKKTTGPLLSSPSLPPTITTRHPWASMGG